MIQGLPGHPSPPFRLRDGRLVSFDALVRSLARKLDEHGDSVVVLDPPTLKALVQAARRVVDGPRPPADVVAATIAHLRAHRVVVAEPHARQALAGWLSLLRGLGATAVGSGPAG